MNKFLHRTLCITALCASCVALADVVPYLAPRSQGINGARELVGWQSQINKWDMCCNYGSFSITPEYTRTFHQHKITEALFCDALTSNSTSNYNTCYNNCDNDCHNGCNSGCGNKILIQGTKVSGRNANALMAENFYLPTDYSSEITFNPRVENFLVDFNYYQGLDEWVEGMYVRIHTPLTWTRWNLDYCEKIISAGTNAMDPGYFNNTYTTTSDAYSPNVYGLNRTQLLGDFEDYISKCQTITGVPGITYDALNSARWSKCHKSKTGLAEITAAWGWNFVRRENFLFGLNIRAAAPTGNRPHGTYLFEPMVGNGHHWELGGGLNMWWTWWRSCDEDRNLTMYLDAYATHMFKTRQCRTFDLKDKPLSRYMLAEKFTTTSVSNLYASNVAAIDAVAPNAQFAKEFTPLANLTTIPVDVSYAAQGEVILKFAYTHCNFQFDLGYDFWGRTCAKICNRCDKFANNTWGLKGDSFAFGFPTVSGVGGAVTNAAIPLSATENNATIFSGTNDYPNGTSLGYWNENPGADNPVAAWNGNSSNSLGLFTHNIGENSGGEAVWHQVLTSLQPVLLTNDNLDISAAKTKAYSNKIFGHFGYTWKEHECWTPYLGIGGEAEFGCHGERCNTNSCHSNNNCHSSSNCHSNDNCHNNNSCHDGNTHCNKFAFTQWGIWLKGGFSFN